MKMKKRFFFFSEADASDALPQRTLSRLSIALSALFRRFSALSLLASVFSDLASVRPR